MDACFHFYCHPVAVETLAASECELILHRISSLMTLAYLSTASESGHKVGHRQPD
jgi:hypothetical protein